MCSKHPYFDLIFSDHTETAASEETGKSERRWREIERFLQTHDVVQSADVRAMFGVSEATAARILTGLVASGLLLPAEKDDKTYRLAAQ